MKHNFWNESQWSWQSLKEIIKKCRSLLYKAVRGSVSGESGLDKWLHRFPRSGFPPTGKGMPMRRFERTLGDFYWFGGKVASAGEVDHRWPV